MVAFILNQNMLKNINLFLNILLDLYCIKLFTYYYSF